MVNTFCIFFISDAEKAIEFLSKQKEKVKANHDAQVLCLTAIGNLKLSEKKLKETKVRCSHQNGIHLRHQCYRQEFCNSHAPSSQFS